MTEKQTVSTTPESDGFAARYDRMVARSGSWGFKAILAIIALIIIIGLVRQFTG